MLGHRFGGRANEATAGPEPQNRLWHDRPALVVLPGVGAKARATNLRDISLGAQARLRHSVAAAPAESMALARCHLEDPETLQIFALYFQAWGRKPED